MLGRYRILCRKSVYHREEGEGAEWVEDPQRVVFDADGKSAESALANFFEGEAGGLENVGWVDGTGRHPFSSFDIDVHRRYTWRDDEGAFMEFVSIWELGAGTVTCPLCGGLTEVTPEVAAQYEEEWEEY